MKRLNADAWIAGALLAVCILFFLDTFSFRENPLAIVKSSTWPRMVLAFLFILSGLYLLRSLKRRPRPAEHRAPLDLGGWLAARRNIIGCFLLFGAFLLLLPLLGMLFGGVLFVFALLTLLGPNTWRSHAINAAIAVLSVGVMWAVFTFGLGVIFPEGELFRLF